MYAFLSIYSMKTLNVTFASLSPGFWVSEPHVLTCLRGDRVLQTQVSGAQCSHFTLWLSKLNFVQTRTHQDLLCRPEWPSPVSLTSTQYGSFLWVWPTRKHHGTRPTQSFGQMTAWDLPFLWAVQTCQLSSQPPSAHSTNFFQLSTVNLSSESSVHLAPTALPDSPLL